MNWFRRMLRRLRTPASGERLLYVTDRAPFQSPEHAVGAVVPHEGEFYEITRWEKGETTYLPRGGAVHEWEVWGRPVPEAEFYASVTEAAEQILRDSAGAGSAGAGNAGADSTSGAEEGAEHERRGNAEGRRDEG